MTRRLIRSVHAGGLSRRQVLRMGSLLVAASFSPSPGWSHPHPSPKRSLTLHNVLTKDDVSVEYWVKGEGFVPDALQRLNHFLRDPRNDEVTKIDPDLFHFIYEIAHKIGAKETDTIHIISGYRSPDSNEQLRRRNSAAAKNSLHVQGQAVDIRIPGYKTGSIHRAARLARAALADKKGKGGVGYYPRSRYVHIDTGPVRSWSA